jgi:NADH dehydrogenase [ubiquinone] 1 alpha subcomplex assembly factor 7
VVSQAFSQFQAAKSAIQEIHLVETSRPLRLTQEQELKPFVEKFGWKIQWHDNLDAIMPADKQYTMVLAHEFFDALPFHLIEVCPPMR